MESVQNFVIKNISSTIITVTEKRVSSVKASFDYRPNININKLSAPVYLVEFV